MDRRRLTLSLAAVLTALCLYYRGGLALLPLLLLPVAAHELAHVLALRLLGRRVTGFHIDAQGFVIGCTGGSVLSNVLIALAGPLGGVVYALLAERAGVGNCCAARSKISSSRLKFGMVDVPPLISVQR